MGFTNPSVSDFSNRFVRDWPYNSNPELGVTTNDITIAMQNASYQINPSFFPDQTSYNEGFFQLSAHFLVLLIRAGTQGVQGKYNWIESSKGVGGASAGYAIPQRILESAQFSLMVSTNYGASYLQSILPYLTGVSGNAHGMTKP